jgi:hypothetical protein
MVARWLSQLKWLLLIAIVAGPGFAYFEYTELDTIKKISAEGVIANAVVDGGETRTGRRSGTSYKIHAIWTDVNNQEHAENIDISSEFAHKIVQDDMLLVDAVQVKYLPSDPKAPVFAADDLPQQQQDKELMMYLGLGAGVVGLIGSAIVFMAGRKKAA